MEIDDSGGSRPLRDSLALTLDILRDLRRVGVARHNND